MAVEAVPALSMGLGTPAATLAGPAPDELLDDVRRITALGNRFAGTAGEARCRELLVQEMKASGLTDVHDEPVQYLGIPEAAAECRLIDGTWAADRAAPLQYTASSRVQGEGIYLGEGSPAELAWADAHGGRLEGKVAVLRAPLIFQVATEVAARGAAAIVNVSPTLGDDPGHFVARFDLPAAAGQWRDSLLPIPGVTISEESAQRLLIRLCLGPTHLVVEHDSTYRDQATANIVGEIPARDDTGDLVVVGAHYDSQREGSGAADNATGLAALLALCRLQDRLEPRRGVIVVAFAAEELGAWGSRAFVNADPDRTRRLVAMVNLDALGSPISATRNVIADPSIRDIATNAAARAGWGPERGVDAAELPFADHGPFSAAGIPSCWLMRFPPNHPYYHTAGDTIRHVDAGHLAQDMSASFNVLRDLIELPAVTEPSKECQ